MLEVGAEVGGFKLFLQFAAGVVSAFAVEVRVVRVVARPNRDNRTV
jgi:hypothetical protein